MNWKPGQKLVCTKRAPWSLVCGSGTCRQPVFNEIVTFLEDGWDPEYIQLVEYSCGLRGERVEWKAAYFQPLVSDAVLAEELSQITETVEV
jgi:hypothetical protein